MKVSWSLPAIRDLEEIQDYVAERRPASAHRLISRIFSQTARLLSERPEIGRVGRVATTRELVITRTPYIVVYRLRTEIEILAVIHGARDWPEGFP